MRHEATRDIEKTLTAVEKSLGVSLTLIDANGLFHSKSGKSLLNAKRQSHQTNDVCRHGFCTACVEHCRHTISAKSDALRQPYVHTCWKGVREVVVPLEWEGQLVGSLFAGVWRSRQRTPAYSRLPEAFRDAYNKLQPLTDTHADDLGKTLAWVAKGLLADLDAALGFRAIEPDLQTQIQRYLIYHLHRPLKLANLADHIHLSPSRASHVVKERFGVSFQTLLSDLRLDRAQALLHQPDLSIADVGRRAGLSDPRYFSRWFRDKAGETPSHYRRRVRDGA